MLISIIPFKLKKVLTIVTQIQTKEYHCNLKMTLFNYIQVPDEGDYGDYTSKWEYLGKGKHKFSAFFRTGFNSKWPIIYMCIQVFGRTKTTEVSVTTAHSKLTHKGILDKKTQQKISISI